MKTWRFGVVVCLVMLLGCAGGLRGRSVQFDPSETAFSADNDIAAEELSGKRLEELYAKSGISGRDPSLEEELKTWEHQVKFDVPIQMNKQVRAYLVYFSTERKEVIGRQLARSTRYLPMIKEIFREYGLPEDLAYLAMIESGFNPNAYSPAGACGMWQFIKGTGLRYGLAINGAIDERRDPVKSTHAAARYLSDLYRQFGSWYLAAASYNCGERRVQQELTRSRHQNFWELSANQTLPGETKNYVPQLIAATIIAKNPEKFGFNQVPHQPTLLADKWEATGPGRNDDGAGKGSLEAAIMAGYTGKRSQAAASHKSSPKLNPSAKSTKKPSTGVAYAQRSRSPGSTATHGNPNLYTASLFGVPYTGASQNKDGKKKSHGQVAANPKKKKTARPALLALKSDSKKTKTSKKSSSSPNNKRRLAKTKSSPLLFSEAR